MVKKRVGLVRRCTKAQASVEVLVIIGALLVILVAGIVFITKQSDVTNVQFRQTATRTALQDIASASKEVYNQGFGARRTIPVYFPSGISSIDFSGNTITANLDSGTQIYEYLGFNASGNLTPSEGNAQVKLDSYGDYVYVQASYGNFTGNITQPIYASPDMQPPNITFENPAPLNGTTILANFTYINTTIMDNISVSTVYLEWNGTNQTITGSGSNYFINKTNLANGQYTFRVYASDAAGNWNVSEARTIIIYANVVIPPPNITFNFQNPVDITAYNLYLQELNISYNISDSYGLNETSVSLYYTVNNSYSNSIIFINGTQSSLGFNISSVKSNLSNTWYFPISSDLIYPGTHNFDPELMENSPHSIISTGNPGDYLKIQFTNISNNSNVMFFEIMINSSISTANDAAMYYCNSSYISGDPATSLSCVNFYSAPPNTPYDHNHTQYSAHLKISLSVSSGRIGLVGITPTSYFIVQNPKFWNIYYIANISRVDAIQRSNNNGGNWINYPGTIDAHVHQFTNDTVLAYYVCAANLFGFSNCSQTRFDLVNISGGFPSQPILMNPQHNKFSGNVIINYTASIQSDGSSNNLYNISLYYINGTFFKTIASNNSFNLNYTWNSAGTADGSYRIRVDACAGGLCSLDTSEIFVTDNFPITTFFYTPTPSHNNVSNVNYTLVNLSVQGNITNFMWNWNNTNYTMYDRSLVLMMNFDNVSAVGDGTDLRELVLDPSSDSFVLQSSAGTNYGLLTYINVSAVSGQAARSLVFFNLTNNLPSGAIIVTANVSLYKYGGSTNNRNYDAKRVTGSWAETTVTWTNQPTTSATATSTVSVGALGLYAFTATSDVIGFVNGSYQNYGWMFNDTGNAAARYSSVYSREYAVDATLRPKLRISYYLPRAADISNYSGNTTCFGMGSTCNWTSGKYGNAILFNGVNSSLSTIHSSSLNAINEMTAEAWINTNSVTGFKPIIEKGATATRSNYYLGTSNNQVYFAFYTSGAWREHTTAAANLATGTWYHVAAAYNDSGNNVRIYVNGEEKLNEAEANSMTQNTDPVFIGTSGANEHFGGTIDEIRIYNISFSASDVRQHYYSNFNKYGVSSWQFWSNQSNLTASSYAYYGCADGIPSNISCTEERTIFIQ